MPAACLLTCSPPQRLTPSSRYHLLPPQISKCECYYLKRNAFTLLLGPMEDIFQKRVSTYSSLVSSCIVAGFRIVKFVHVTVPNISFALGFTASMTTFHR